MQPRRRRAPARGAAPTLALLALTACSQPGGPFEPTAEQRALVEEARSQAAAGARAHAHDLLAQIVTDAPRYAQAWRLYAEVASQRQDWARAIEAGRALLGLDARDISAATVLLTAGLRLGEVAAAREGLLVLEAQAPEASSTHEFAAELLLEEGQLALAVERASQALAGGSRWARGHQILGLEAEARDALMDARMHYESALELDPTHIGSRDRLATLLAQAGEESEAARHRELSQQMTAATSGGYRRLPAQERLARFEPLCHELEFWPLAWVEHARALLDLRRPAEARRVILRGLVHHPDHPELTELLAQARTGRGS